MADDPRLQLIAGALREVVFDPTRPSEPFFEDRAREFLVMFEAASAKPRRVDQKRCISLAPIGECSYCDHRRQLDLNRVQQWRERRREEG